MITRYAYLDVIKPFMDKPLVKILTGVRRCGKSTILEMVKKELLQRGILLRQIISRNYAHTQFDDWTAKEMHADLMKDIGNAGRTYLFLDEVQEVPGWEKVVNTLQEECDVDIYVTGSNSKLMSSEISTYLAGRYVSIPVYTLSFEEYLSFKGKTDADSRTLLPDYLRYGGFPIVAVSDFDANSAYKIVEDIYAAVVTRDISKRHKIRNKELFDRVVKFIVENVGKTFSANSIVIFLKNERRVLSVETIYNYLKWLADAFIIYPCRRYDLRGKSVLKTQEKYYLSDISIKYSQMGFDAKMISAMMENVVFLEMKRRGYEVCIGKNDAKEIDFVGRRKDERVYVQVCRNLPEDSERETANLMDIKDHYPKYVVMLDEFAQGNDNGIRFVHLADFLLRKNW